MKKSILATTFLLSATTAAFAADPAARRAFVPVAPPAFSWTGFYIGLNAGYAFEHERERNVTTITFPNNNYAICGTPGSLPPLSADITPCSGVSGFTSTNPLFPNTTPFYVIGNNGNPDGPFIGSPFSSPPTTLTIPAGHRDRRNNFIAGIQSGYNFQFTPGSGLVIGYESDIQLADFDRRHRDCGIVGCGGATLGPGVIGSPFFSNPVVIPIQTGAAQAIAAIPASGNPVGTGALAQAFTGTGVGGINTGSGFTTGNGGMFLNNGPYIGTAAQNASTQAVAPVTFFNPIRDRRIEYFGTVRARVGYAWDRLLAFATGGFAYGGGGCGFFHDCDGTRYGWAAGGGLEYAVLDNLSVKLEGLYVNLRDGGGGTVAGTAIPYARDSAGVTYFAPASAFGVARRQGDSFIVARVGVNYRFSFGR